MAEAALELVLQLVLLLVLIAQFVGMCHGVGWLLMKATAKERGILLEHSTPIIDALAAHLTKHGFGTTLRTKDKVRFVRKAQPDIQMAIFLTFVFVLLGLFFLPLLLVPVAYFLYFRLANPLTSFEVATEETPEGMLVHLSGKDRKGRRYTAR